MHSHKRHMEQHIAVANQLRRATVPTALMALVIDFDTADALECVDVLDDCPIGRVMRSGRCVLRVLGVHVVRVDDLRDGRQLEIPAGS